MQYTLLTLALAAFAVADKTVTETPTAEAKPTDTFTVRNIAQVSPLCPSFSLTFSLFCIFSPTHSNAQSPCIYEPLTHWIPSSFLPCH